MNDVLDTYETSSLTRDHFTLENQISKNCPNLPELQKCRNKQNSSVCGGRGGAYVISNLADKFQHGQRYS